MNVEKVINLAVFENTEQTYKNKQTKKCGCRY